MNVHCYELLVIMNARLEKVDSTALIQQIKEEITKKDGEIVLIDEIGRKRLAFPIKRQTEGFYILIYCKLSSSEVDRISKKFNINEAIVRHMFLVKTENEIKKIVLNQMKSTFQSLKQK